jgi:hypothetical protein
MMQLSLM